MFSKPEGEKKAEKGGFTKQTAGSFFRSQLNILIATLNSTTCHYVRCIKPNTNKSAFDFDDSMVLGWYC